MKFYKLYALVCALALILLTGCAQDADESSRVQKPIVSVASDSYTGIIASTSVSLGGYCLLNSSGEVFKYNGSGLLEKKVLDSGASLRCIAAYNASVLVAGRDNAVYYAENSLEFKKLTPSGDFDYFSACKGEDGFILGCGDGSVVRVTLEASGVKFSVISTPLHRPVISVAYGAGRIVAVTADGYIATIDTDATQTLHSVSDYYTGTYTLSGVMYSGTAFWMCGAQTDNSVAVTFVSEKGELLTKRAIDYIENKYTSFDPPLVIYSLAWDGEQTVASCNLGRLLTLPDCSRCNKITTLCENELYTVSSDESGVITAGSDNYVAVEQTDALRQNNISGETAVRYFKNGGILIDVRTADEYNKGHISGSVNIPLDILEDELAKRYPDKKTMLIFYCAVGVRSASAAKKANEAGYQNAYSMGAITNWIE